MKLIYKFRTQTPAKRKLIAIWGSGTLGGAIIDEFKNHGYDIIEQNFSWVREDKQKTQLNMILEKIADICKNRCTEIHLIWAAGNTSFFSKAFDLKRETRALKLICEYFGRQCHFNKLSLHVHFMSSAGALFEGHRLIKDDTRPDPKNLYGMNKSQQEALLKRLIGRYCSVNIYRPSTVYGPSNNKQREGLILAIVKNSLQRRPTRYYAKMDTLRDYVFNLAASISVPYSFKNPQTFIDTNILGALNVFRASSLNKKKIKKIIQISSSEVYGNNLTKTKNILTEETITISESPYASTKIASDNLAISMHKATGLPIVVARPFNTFGPRQSLRAVIPTLITQFISLNSRNNLIKIGNIKTSRDFVYVKDTVDGLISLLKNTCKPGEIYNICTGKSFSIKSMANWIWNANKYECK